MHKASYGSQKTPEISRDPKNTSISYRNISRCIGCGLDLIRNLSGGVWWERNVVTSKK